MILIHIIVFIIGLAFLVKGADYFIKAAASIAKILGLSEFVIGLTLVALGTSIPELASAIAAAMKNSSGLVIGSVVGSNISNICLIIGSAAVVCSITTKQEMLKRDGYMMLFAAGVFFLCIIDRRVSRFDALIFLFLYLSYMFFLFEMDPQRKRYYFGDFVKYFFQFRFLTTLGSRIYSGFDRTDNLIPKEGNMREGTNTGLIRDSLQIVAGGAAVIAGAHYLVQESLYFADLWSIPETLVGVTVIAIGTSLPELSVSIAAARKGYGSMAVGNVLGSNIVNLLLVLGISGLISPLSVSSTSLFLTAPFMIVMSGVLLIFIRSHWEIKRAEGLAFLGMYAAFIAFLFW